MTSLLTESIEANTPKVPANLQEQREKSREKVIELLSQPLLPSEQEKVYSQLKEFIEFSFGYDLLERYHHIKASIFDLTRQQKVEVKGDSYHINGSYVVSVPSIVKIPFSEKNNGSYKVMRKTKRLNDNYERDIELFCTIPEITPEARSAYADSMGFCAEIVSRAYKDSLLSKILLRDTGKEIQSPLDSEYFLVWAPSAWDAKLIPRPERDPAIFMNYNGWNFSVYQWDVPEERSLDAMLREFRETF